MSFATLLGRVGGRDQEELRTSLAVVEDDLVEQARRQATAAIEEAARDADAALQHARTAIHQLIEQAREEGQAAAGHSVESTISQARSDARALVLSAERRVDGSLRRRAVEELARRGAGRAAVDLEERLAPLARQRLGDGARTERPTTPPMLWSGLTVRAGSRQASVTVEALVDHQLAAMAAEVEQLWS